MIHRKGIGKNAKRGIVTLEQCEEMQGIPETQSRQLTLSRCYVQ